METGNIPGFGQLAIHDAPDNRRIGFEGLSVHGHPRTGVRHDEFISYGMDRLDPDAERAPGHE